MKNWLYILSLIVIASCDTDQVDENPEKPDTDQQNDNYFSEDEIIRSIEAQLRIPATEKYTYKIYEAHLTADDSIDRIVTVNLLDRAINEAMESGKTAKRAEMGYMGNYNYFFYIDGLTQQITSPIVVPSSPLAELKVDFLNITSDQYLDFTIDTKIMLSSFRKFYTIQNSIPMQTSETELYTDIGTADEKLYAVKYEPGSFSMGKNIVIYEGTTEQVDLSKPDAIYELDIKIEPTDKLVRRWYYSPQHQKYYLKNSEI